MTPKILLRVASVLLLLFAAGHTTGHLGRKNSTDPRAQALIREMEDYHFDFKGTSQTLDGHMEGYGIMTTFILVSLAILLWIVSSNLEKNPRYSNKILYPVLLFMIGNGYVAYRYFFLGPAVFSALVVVLIAASIFSLVHAKAQKNT
jgi:hypothetical protein